MHEYSQTEVVSVWPGLGSRAGRTGQLPQIVSFAGTAVNRHRGLSRGFTRSHFTSTSFGRASYLWACSAVTMRRQHGLCHGVRRRVVATGSTNPQVIACQPPPLKARRVAVLHQGSGESVAAAHCSGRVLLCSRFGGPMWPRRGTWCHVPVSNGWIALTRPCFGMPHLFSDPVEVA